MIKEQAIKVGRKTLDKLLTRYFPGMKFDDILEEFFGKKSQ
jgi:hypothetical protein